MDKMTEQEETDNHPLFLLRRLERIEFLFGVMVEKGVLSHKDLQKANLRSTLNHAERIIRTREKANTPHTEIDQAAAVIRENLEDLDATA